MKDDGIEEEKYELADRPVQARLKRIRQVNELEEKEKEEKK